MADAPGIDAIVLDVGLPDVSGLEVARRLRARGSRVPILMLTARDAVADRVAGLDAGADDYLVKPFAIEELAARVRALGRRGAPGGGDGAVDDRRAGAARRGQPDRRRRRAAGGPQRRASSRCSSACCGTAARSLSRDQLLRPRLAVRRRGRARRSSTRTSTSCDASWAPAGGGRIETVRGVGYRMVRDRR